ncbi:CamS family sex pheromone protein [Carnobacterium gallinarum]|uniref:CamS family sex pheromone protein n=1 Tax=Carnobacterium gallinarum TaxID=2749 RepID=UPI000550CAA0|nr:CamS family sex pheromone protein [Carnobacterium gallinarum]
MNKKIIALLGACLILLSACGNVTNTNTETNSDSSKGTEKVTKTQLSKDYYRVVMKNDKEYQTSPSRGVSLSLNSGYNMKAFESGLIGLSQTPFPTDNNYFREGQLIDSATAKSWIGRKAEVEDPNSSAGPNGLNPPDNGQIEPDTRAPRYLAQILEQNYMVKDGDNYKLSGVSIGLALNSVDYYQKVLYGAEFQTPISRADFEAKGKEIANEVVARLRKKDGMGNVPIMVALFEQSAKDTLAGGVYFASAMSENGSTTVGEWSAINDQKIIFPNNDGKSSEEKTNFDNFKNSIQSFFPNLSGVTAEAYYQNNQLSKMAIKITTQFYGESEIISFTQFIADKTSLLPATIPIEITVNSMEGIEAFLSRDANTTEFKYHIFD